MVNYTAITQHLLAPLVEFPDQLAIDSETSAAGRYVLVRVAVADSDREKVTGKNGRTLNMMRTILGIAAQNASQRVDLNLYTEQTDTPPRKPRRPRSWT